MAQQLEQGLVEPLAAEDDAIAASATQWGLVWQRFRRNRSALLGACIVRPLISAPTLPPWLPPHDPSQIFDGGLTPEGAPAGPSRTFPLGADALGHDQLSRILYGARV